MTAPKLSPEIGNHSPLAPQSDELDDPARSFGVQVRVAAVLLLATLGYGGTLLATRAYGWRVDVVRLVALVVWGAAGLPVGAWLDGQVQQRVVRIRDERQLRRFQRRLTIGFALSMLLTLFIFLLPLVVMATW
ncbi:MAG: hypothetical protein ACRDHE_03395 [Ktedonobacterales bacterium]